jgi:hypothetical protein
MTLLRVLVLGPLPITTNTLIASEFKCPTPSQFQNVTCENYTCQQKKYNGTNLLDFDFSE